jgi:hypothetical protein
MIPPTENGQAAFVCRRIAWCGIGQGSKLYGISSNGAMDVPRRRHVGRGFTPPPPVGRLTPVILAVELRKPTGRLD